MSSLKDEVAYFFSGRGMPYQKLAIVVAVIVTVMMTSFLSNNIMRNSNITVIDLDNSRYSRELTEKLNTSSYIEVQNVVYSPTKLEKFFFMDKNVAIVYLPKGLEKDRFSGTSTSIGVFYDNTNTAWTGEVKSALNEIVAMENSTGSHIALNDRILFNPTGSSSSGIVLYFLFFFSSIFFALNTLGMVPRLRMEGKLDLLLAEGNPLSLLSRLLPYCGCFITALAVGLVMLRFVGDLTINGNLLLFLFTQLLYVFVLGVLCLIMGWNAKNPGLASGRMTLFVPLGFILGGAALPTNSLSDWVWALSHIFPLTWEFHFVRDVLLRGAGFWDIGQLLGCYAIYIGIVLGIYGLLFQNAAKKLCLKDILVAKRATRVQ